MRLLLDLLQILGNLYITIVLLRFILQVCRADFYNPITQVIVRATNPLLIPLRRIVPSYRGFDMASLVLAFLLQLLLVFLLNQVPLEHLGALVGKASLLAILELLRNVVQLYTWAVILMVILSWVNPGMDHPGARLLHQITEPLMAPVRKLLPSAGGLDFSPMVVMILLFILGGILTGRYV